MLVTRSSCFTENRLNECKQHPRCVPWKSCMKSPQIMKMLNSTGIALLTTCRTDLLRPCMEMINIPVPAPRSPRPATGCKRPLAAEGGTLLPRELPPRPPPFPSPFFDISTSLRKVQEQHLVVYKNYLVCLRLKRRPYMLKCESRDKLRNHAI